MYAIASVTFTETQWICLLNSDGRKTFFLARVPTQALAPSTRAFALFLTTSDVANVANAIPSDGCML